MPWDDSDSQIVAAVRDDETNDWSTAGFIKSL